ncbi:MAG: DUF5668 domain-containing protein [Bacteroidota bacterium]
MEKIDFQNNKPNHKSKRIVFGLFVIIVGILLMMRNLEILNPFWCDIIFSWEMLLIAIGFVNIFKKDSTVGIIIMLIGAFFLLNNFFELPWNVKAVFWPFILILIGVGMLFKSNRRHSCRREKCSSSSISSDDFFKDVAIFGGSERNIVSKKFKGGKTIAVFGGSTFDMTQSELSDETNVIESIMIMGGSKFIVPSDWNVKIEVVSVFGGFDDKRVINKPVSDSNKWLVIKGLAIFGGGEIKSF